LRRALNISACSVEELGEEAAQQTGAPDAHRN
jgi:hypothetical protein